MGMGGIPPDEGLVNTYRCTSRFSHTIRVSTAPISRQASVSFTPNTNLPVSWLIWSKKLRRRGGAEGKGQRAGAGRQAWQRPWQAAPAGFSQGRAGRYPGMMRRCEGADRAPLQPARHHAREQTKGASRAGPTHLLISRFSCTNLTLASVSADSSIAWLKPFSPPGTGRKRRVRGRRLVGETQGRVGSTEKEGCLLYYLS